jgi:hypothetical protein
MGQLITVYAQPATYQAYQLQAAADMVAALSALQANGYSGNMSMDANGNWELWFQSTSQNASWNAKVGDWIVIKNGSIASSVPAAQATALYTTTPPA